MITPEQIASFKQEGGGFQDRADVKRAEHDFRYLCEQHNFFVSANLGLLSLNKSGVKHGDALVIPFNVKDKVVHIPHGMVKLGNSGMYVAVVCYLDEKPIDVLMFASELFEKPKKIFGYNKRTNEFEVVIKNINDSLVQSYVFDKVFGHLQG